MRIVTLVAALAAASLPGAASAWDNTLNGPGQIVDGGPGAQAGAAARSSSTASSRATGGAATGGVATVTVNVAPSPPAGSGAAGASSGGALGALDPTAGKSAAGGSAAGSGRGAGASGGSGRGGHTGGDGGGAYGARGGGVATVAVPTQAPSIVLGGTYGGGADCPTVGFSAGGSGLTGGGGFGPSWISTDCNNRKLAGMLYETGHAAAADRLLQDTFPQVKRAFAEVAPVPVSAAPAWSPAPWCATASVAEQEKHYRDCFTE